MTKTFILVDPNDDTGNDDGILDRMDMTQEQANKFNQDRRDQGSDLRWIALRPERRNHLTHSTEYDD